MRVTANALHIRHVTSPRGSCTKEYGVHETRRQVAASLGNSQRAQTSRGQCPISSGERIEVSGSRPSCWPHMLRRCGRSRRGRQFQAPQTGRQSRPLAKRVTGQGPSGFLWDRRGRRENSSVHATAGSLRRLTVLRHRHSSPRKLSSEKSVGRLPYGRLPPTSIFARLRHAVDG